MKKKENTKLNRRRRMSSVDEHADQAERSPAAGGAVNQDTHSGNCVAEGEVIAYASSRTLLAT